MSTDFVLIWHTIATTRVLVQSTKVVVVTVTTRSYVQVVNAKRFEVIIRTTTPVLQQFLHVITKITIEGHEQGVKILLQFIPCNLSWIRKEVMELS